MKDNALISGGHRLPPHVAVMNVIASIYQSMGGDLAQWDDEPIELKIEYRELALRLMNEAYVDHTQPDRPRCNCMPAEDGHGNWQDGSMWLSASCPIHAT